MTTHVANCVRDYLEATEIRILTWPARSLDLNPIEGVWDDLGTTVRRRKMQAAIQIVVPSRGAGAIIRVRTGFVTAKTTIVNENPLVHVQNLIYYNLDYKNIKRLVFDRSLHGV